MGLLMMEKRLSAIVATTQQAKKATPNACDGHSKLALQGLGDIERRKEADSANLRGNPDSRFAFNL